MSKSEQKLIKSESESAHNIDSSNNTSGKQHRLFEIALTTLLGMIPTPVGITLRRLLYPLMFSRLDRNSYIQPGCEFFGANRVEIGTTAKILRDVRIQITPNSLLKIGDGVCLDRGVDINTAGEDCLISIGDNALLGPYVCMAGPGHIKIGKNCAIASQSGLYANNHRVYGLSREGIEIEDNCWLGTGVRVLDGVRIGRGSVIGAGAVVTKDIPPYSVAVGVPAKVIKKSAGEGCC